MNYGTDSNPMLKNPFRILFGVGVLGVIFFSLKLLTSNTLPERLILIFVIVTSVFAVYAGSRRKMWGFYLEQAVLCIFFAAGLINFLLSSKNIISLISPIFVFSAIIYVFLLIQKANNESKTRHSLKRNYKTFTKMTLIFVIGVFMISTFSYPYLLRVSQSKALKSQISKCSKECNASVKKGCYEECMRKNNLKGVEGYSRNINGWITFKPQRGNFQIDFPKYPSNFIDKSRSQLPQELINEYYASDDDEGNTYFVTENKINPENRVSDLEYLQSIVNTNTAGLGGNLISSKEIIYKSYSAVDYVITNGNGDTYHRSLVLVVDGNLIELGQVSGNSNFPHFNEFANSFEYINSPPK